MGPIPFSVLPLALYGLAYVVFGSAAPDSGAAADGARAFVARPLWQFGLVSGEVFVLRLGDALVVFGAATLLASQLYAASRRRADVLAKMLRVVVLCLYVVAFLTIGFAGTSTFFILTVLALVDTLAAIALAMVKSDATRGEPIAAPGSSDPAR